jgi:hypothetical protein
VVVGYPRGRSTTVQEEGANQILQKIFNLQHTDCFIVSLLVSSGRLLEECLRYFHVHWSEQGLWVALPQCWSLGLSNNDSVGHVV